MGEWGWNPPPFISIIITMKANKILVVILCLLILASALLASSGTFSSKGEKMYRSALRLEKQADYFKAFDAYKIAKTRLAKEKRTKLADKCRENMTRMEKIRLTYTHTEEAVRGIIRQNYPKMTAARINEVIREGRLPNIKIGGKTYYFVDFMNTLYHLYPDFREIDQAGALGKVTKLFDMMGKYIYEKDAGRKGQTLFNPISYIADASMTLQRKKLPKTGTLKVWMPLPLAAAAQQNIKIISVYPERYIRYPMKLDGDIGVVYMEIPLREIKGDLKIGSKFNFTHYEERFNIDPEKIGEYDRKSDLYRRYTASGRNIAVTPSIAAKARKLAGREKNPYRIARIFYDHIVYDLDYSYTPHAALESLGIPESVFVHENGIGDCGAQSMYFSALCRSMGIPARAAGGMQLFPVQKTGCGDHFWAQVYFPNYGWVPADTSVAQLIKYMGGASKKQEKEYVDYFFAKMDPFRYLIQVDADIPFIPAPDEPPVFSMVLQEPAMTCREMDISPGIVFLDAWKVRVKKEGIK